jgi:hypothetical protein
MEACDLMYRPIWIINFPGDHTLPIGKANVIMPQRPRECTARSARQDGRWSARLARYRGSASGTVLVRKAPRGYTVDGPRRCVASAIDPTPEGMRWIRIGDRAANILPGWATLWRGMQTLSVLVEGVRIARKLTDFG